MGHAREHSLLPLGAAAVAVALALLAVLRDNGGGAAPTPVGATVEAEVEALRAEVAELKQRLGAAGAMPASASPLREEAVTQARIDEMVATALAARGFGSGSGAAAAAAAKAVRDPAKASAVAALVQQLAATPAGPERDALWQQLRALGEVEAAVAQYEQLAAAQPGDPDAQTNLGAAYIEQMMQAADEAARIEIGKKIDAQFDKALALDENHWEARFRKAVGLTYGPALSGRQDEAIGHFEKLVQQQAGQRATPEQAQTYVYLARLYAQRGDAAKAAAIVQQGLLRHPQDDGLRQAAPK